LNFLKIPIILIIQEIMMAGQISKETSSCGCCQVEAVVSVDDRGQMVLPKEIREKAGIKPGDKLALIGWEEEGRLCCISLLKAEQLGGMVKVLLAPMLRELEA
jgi:AbrB family looped-hinge helix DNA binding protein